MSQTKPSPTRIKSRTSVKAAKGSAAVTYGALSHALEKLGYQKVPAEGSHIVFVHPNSKAHLFLPWRLPSENVDLTRLTGVYELVESAGIASRDAVRSALENSPRAAQSRNGRVRGKAAHSPGKARQARRNKTH